MERVRRVPRSINALVCGAMVMLAWAGEVVAQPSASAGQQRNQPSSTAVAAPSADGTDSPFVVLTREDRRVEEVTTEAKDSKPKSVKRSETQSKRQVAVRVRTEIVHPTPQIRHASATYQPIYPERTAAEQRIHLALARPVLKGWAWNEAPLRDVCERVEEQFGIRCQIDHRALDDSGLDVDTPVTSNLTDISLRSALRQLLGNLDLAFLVKEETLLVTTKEEAEEHLEVVLYPLPTAHAPAEVVDLIQSVVAADTWDSVGGQGAIRPLLASSELIVSQTLEVHEQVAKLMARFDADLGLTDGTEAPAAVRVYPVRDPQVLAELQAKLVATCNAALGKAADPAAGVSSLGGKLVVQSASRPFHVYAAEVVRSINGLDVVKHDVVSEQQGLGLGGMGMGGGAEGMGMGGMLGGGGFCWVAREVYGDHDPRWLVFRAWLLNEAPAWLRETYARHGEWFAAWLRRHPAAKAVLRPLMDAAIAGGR